MTLTIADPNERHCLFCGNVPKSGEDCVEGRRRHRYVGPDTAFCGACGEAAGDCNHADGPVYDFPLVVARWASGKTCWPSWTTAEEYRAGIAEMMAAED